MPFDAIDGFFDPSVQFGLQFEEVTESEDRPAPANVQEPLTTNNKKKRHPTVTPAPVAATEPENQHVRPRQSPNARSRKSLPEVPAEKWFDSIAFAKNSPALFGSRSAFVSDVIGVASRQHPQVLIIADELDGQST